MFKLPPWQTAAAEPVWILGLFVLGYCLYHFFTHSKRAQEAFPKDATYVLFGRYLGGFTIGFIPVIILLVVTGKELTDYGLVASLDMASVYWVLGLACLILPMNYLNTQKATHLRMYPTVRRQEWKPLEVMNYAISWIVYLLGYELMFRGVLLLGLVAYFGVWPTIALNVVLYVLVHLPKSTAESIGAFPLGLLLCLITLSTGTIWVAVLVHITLALSNFFFSLYHHPDMHLTNKLSGA